MLLSEVTKGNYNHCCQDLGNGRVNFELLYKQFNEYIIEDDTNQDEYKIAEQLDPAFQGRSGKYNEAVKKISGRETYHKRHQKGHDMRTHSAHWRMNDLFIEYIIIGNKVDQDIKYGIPASAGCIPECLLRHEPAKPGIEKIQ